MQNRPGITARKRRTINVQQRPAARLGEFVRTPEEHFAVTSAIMAKLPANDSDIFGPKPRTSKSARHTHLAEKCGPLWWWREMMESPATWLMAANDNGSADEAGATLTATYLQEADFECELEMRPSVEEIMLGLPRGDAPGAYPGNQHRPDPNPKYRPDPGVAIYRVGTMRFVNSEMVRWGISLKKEDGFAPREKSGTPKGAAPKGPSPAAPITGRPLDHADPSIAAPDGLVCNYLPYKFFSRKSPVPELEVAHRMFGGHVSFAEARARADLPPRAANDNDVAANADWFMGGRIQPRGESGGTFDEGALGALIRQEEKATMRAEASAEAVLSLDTALESRNFSNIGALFGASGKNAERVGKEKLLAAVAELDQVRARILAAA